MPMRSIRQIVQVDRDRKIELTLPAGIDPGLVEIVIVFQSLPETENSTAALEPPNLFGFLPKRIDPLAFQQEMRDEWNR